MKTPADDWTPEERDALQELQAELEALQDRHADDPPLDLLRAARAGVLPEPPQTTLANRLSASRWDRALVEGAEHPEAELDEHRRARMLRRIQGKAAPQRQTRGAFARWWPPALAAAAVVVLAVAGWRFLGIAGGDRPSTPSESNTSVRSAPTPSFVLPLDPPDVKLSASALVFRGRANERGLLNDLKPALDAFQAADYSAADRVFAELAPRYPTSVEVAFYGGVTRLLLGDAAGAAERFEAAERIGDEAFANDIAWYWAVADERAGSRERARTRLLALCRTGGSRSLQACAAAEGLKVRWPASYALVLSTVLLAVLATPNVSGPAERRCRRPRRARRERLGEAGLRRRPIAGHGGPRALRRAT